MRAFSTFLSLFTLLFFLCPILCLSQGEKTKLPTAETEEIDLPQTIDYQGESVALGDFLVQSLAALEVQDYNEEALKAIAVVLTSQLRCALSTEEGAAQMARLTPQEAKERWGDYWFSQYWPKLEAAVRATWGITLQTEGTPFSPSLFPLSWGMTAEGIECPYDFTAEGFEQTRSFPLANVQLLFPDCKGLTVKKARSGRVESVISGSITLTGTQVAAYFNLPSPCFTALVEEDTVTFYCKGIGSGEGMSLYAANESAKRGADYRGILAAFYPQATLTE